MLKRFLLILCVSLFMLSSSLAEKNEFPPEDGLNVENIPRQGVPGANDISEDEAIRIAIQTLTEKFGYLSDYFATSEVECTFYVIPLEYSNYDCEEIWRVELRDQGIESSPFTVELSGQGKVLMYKAPMTLPFYGFEDLLAEAQPAVQTPFDASQEQVIAEIRAAIRESGCLGEVESQSLKIDPHFIYHDRFCYGKEPVWLVYIYNEDALIGQALCGYDGNLIAIEPAGVDFTRTVRNGYEDDISVEFNIIDFWHYSIDERAAFSEKWIPLVRDAITNDPYFAARNPSLIYATQHVYGRPQPEHLSIEESSEIAKQAAISLGADAATFESRNIETLFDITDPNEPLWKMLIWKAQTNTTAESRAGDALRFRIVINASSGAIVEQYIITSDMDSDDYRF